MNLRNLLAGFRKSSDREQSGFDRLFYLATNPDVAAARIDPFLHFMEHGWKEGRNPSPHFNTLYYKDKNLKGDRGINPYSHYEHNKRDMRLPIAPADADEWIALQKDVVKEYFDELFYKRNYLTSEPHADALDHYLRTGWKHGFNPTSDFSSYSYLKAHAYIGALNISPFYHHITTNELAKKIASVSVDIPLVSRVAVIKAISGEFDEQFYLKENPDVREAKVRPLLHYVDYGWKEGRNPNPLFWSAYYLFQYEDVRNADINPFYHYLTSGRAEGRKPNPIGTTLWARPVAPTSEDWAHAFAAKDVNDAEIDVIMPVYKGLQDTLAAIYAVLHHRQAVRFELVVINDRSPDAELTRELQALHARGLFTYLENEENLGFVRTVNKGLSLHPDRDVILLNSDTLVHGNWIDRLIAHALKDEKVATITPFSNNATICSYPEINRNNLISLEASPAELDDDSKLCNAGLSSPVPTGVGFCFYMRRAILREIGLLDAEAFGQGYGEENDYCLRALKAGFKNLFAHDVFVYHSGQISFAEQALAKFSAGQTELYKKHPDYLSRIELYTKADPAYEARLRLDLFRLARSLNGKRAVLVTHALQGGIVTHVRDLATRLKKEGYSVLTFRVGAGKDDEIAFSLEDEAGAPFTPSLGRISINRHSETLAAFITWLKPEILHIHSFVGLSWGATQKLIAIIREATPHYECTLHDFTALCHRNHFVTMEGSYCKEPPVEACFGCIRADKEENFYVDPVERRRAYEAFLKGARRLFVPSADTAHRLKRVFADLDFTVRPHEDTLPETRWWTPDFAPPLRVAFIGALGLPKGRRVIQSLAMDAKLRQLPIAFKVIGYTDAKKPLAELGVEETGCYADEQEALDLLAAWQPHLAFFPSIWPETYCYTLSLALAAGVPCIAFDLGAPAERLRAMGVGSILAPVLADWPAALNDTLLSLPLRDLWEKRIRFEPTAYARLDEDYYGLR